MFEKIYEAAVFRMGDFFDLHHHIINVDTFLAHVLRMSHFASNSQLMCTSNE